MGLLDGCRLWLLDRLGLGFHGGLGALLDEGHQAVVADQPDAGLAAALADARRLDLAVAHQGVEVRTAQARGRAALPRLGEAQPLGADVLGLGGAVFVGRDGAGFVGVGHVGDERPQAFIEIPPHPFFGLRTTRFGMFVNGPAAGMVGFHRGRDVMIAHQLHDRLGELHDALLGSYRRARPGRFQGAIVRLLEGGLVDLRAYLAHGDRPRAELVRKAEIGLGVLVALGGLVEGQGEPFVGQAALAVLAERPGGPGGAREGTDGFLDAGLPEHVPGDVGDDGVGRRMAALVPDGGFVLQHEGDDRVRLVVLGDVRPDLLDERHERRREGLVRGVGLPDHHHVGHLLEVIDVAVVHGQGEQVGLVPDDLG